MNREDMNKEEKEPKFDRREFFRSCGRYAALAAVSLGGGSLIVKKIRRPEHSCVSNGLCDSCSDLSGCVMPQAMSARQALSAGQANEYKKEIKNERPER